jgi:hypothetical protein
MAELAGRGHDVVAFWRECTEAVAPVVPFYLTPCVYTLEPASLLITSHYHDGLPEIPREWLALEYYEDDVSKLADVARSPRGIATLHDATGGDVGLSARTACPCSRWAATRRHSWAYAPRPVRRGNPGPVIANRGARASLATSSSSCATCRATWRKALAAAC